MRVFLPLTGKLIRWDRPEALPTAVVSRFTQFTRHAQIALEFGTPSEALRFVREKHMSDDGRIRTWVVYARPTRNQ